MKEELEKIIEDAIAELNHLRDGVLTGRDINKIAKMLRRLYEER